MQYQHIIEALPAPDFSEFVPLKWQHHAVGCMHARIVPLLAAYPHIFQDVDGQSMRFADEFLALDIAKRSALLEIVSHDLKAHHVVPNWREEHFTVYLDAARTLPLFQIERGVLPVLGLQAHGVHLNGFTFIEGEPHIWVAERSATRPIAPLKLDQLVAGGLPADLTLLENVCKEAGEEAGIPEVVARTAQPFGSLQYLTPAEDGFGIRNDMLHAFDIELPIDFMPHNQDGEVARFMRLPLPELWAILKKPDQFKPNTAWVMLHFLLRRGWLDVSEAEARYLAEHLSLSGNYAPHHH